MKLAVVGSRDFDNYELLKKKLDKINKKSPITLFISGGAHGADHLGEMWAEENDIPKKIFKPDWDKFGRAAGIIRNKDIVTSAEIVVAFWDGESRGTKNSIDLAKTHSKILKIVKF